MRGGRGKGEGRSPETSYSYSSSRSRSRSLSKSHRRPLSRSLSAVFRNGSSSFHVWLYLRGRRGGTKRGGGRDGDSPPRPASLPSSQETAAERRRKEVWKKGLPATPPLLPAPPTPFPLLLILFLQCRTLSLSSSFPL